MPRPTPELRLVTIPMSHYCEKARWALDRSGLPWTEDRHLQAFHWPYAYGHGRTRFVPVLRHGRTRVPDSTAILRYLDTLVPEEKKLVPAALEPQVTELEERYDAGLGVESRRWVYGLGLEDLDLLLLVAAQGVPAWERTVFRAAFPILKSYARAYLKVEPDLITRGLELCRRELDDVAKRLADGRRFLLGDRFTAADLTFASLAAPLVCPPNYGVRLPELEELPAAAATVVREVRAHPAGAFVLRLFREERLRA